MVCALAAQMYRCRIEKEDAERLCAVTFDEDDFMLDEQLCGNGLRMLQTWFEGDDLGRPLARASDDFHDLFIGPHKLVAPPWSSIYLDEGGILFGPTALKVREIFAVEGYRIPEGTAEPADHIAYELQFLSNLQVRGVEAWQSGDEEGACRAVARARDFTERFLCPWIEPFCERVSMGASTGFYRGLSDFTRGLVRLEQTTLLEVEGRGWA